MPASAGASRVHSPTALPAASPETRKLVFARGCVCVRACVCVGADSGADKEPKLPKRTKDQNEAGKAKATRCESKLKLKLTNANAKRETVSVCATNAFRTVGCKLHVWRAIVGSVKNQN